MMILNASPKSTATVETTRSSCTCLNNSYTNHSSSQQRNSNNNLDEGIYSIDNISQYHNKWKLITHAKIRSQKRGSGKLFNVTSMDDSGEEVGIRILTKNKIRR